MMAYLAFSFGLVLIMTLVMVDSKLGLPLGERALLALAWPVFAGGLWWRVDYLGHDPSQMAWFGALGYLTIIAASGGRPALIMWEALPGKAKSDPKLIVRSRITTAAFLGVVAVAIIIYG